LVVGRNYELSFAFVNIVYPEEGAGEGSGLSEGNEQRLVDLTLRGDEGSAKEQDQTSKRENKGGYEL
jgi:hypothetical protein